MCQCTRCNIFLYSSVFFCFFLISRSSNRVLRNCLDIVISPIHLNPLCQINLSNTRLMKWKHVSDFLPPVPSVNELCKLNLPRALCQRCIFSFFYRLIAFSFDNEVCGVHWKWEWEIKLSRWFVWSWAWLIPLFGPDWLSLTQDLAFSPGTGVPPVAYLCLFSVMELLPGGCNEREGEEILQVRLTVTGTGIERARFLKKNYL